MYKQAVEVPVELCEHKLGCGLPLHRFCQLLSAICLSSNDVLRFSLDSGKGALWLNQSVPIPR